MAKRLGKFELPNRLIKEEETATEKYAKFIADPFESGYGHTIGNAFRSVLLSSIEGAAISSFKIDVPVAPKIKYLALIILIYLRFFFDFIPSFSLCLNLKITIARAIKTIATAS